MTECFRSIGKAFRRFWKDETGNQAVQMACLTPILLILIAFIFDRFIIYEGVTAVSYAGNEALRIAVIKPDEGAAKQSVLATLSDRLDATGMGWCSSNDVKACIPWSHGAAVSGDTKNFAGNKNIRVAMSTDKGWCNGSTVTLSIRAHKAALMPSYTTLRRLLKNGGPVYHEHVYTIKARVESSNLCS